MPNKKTRFDDLSEFQLDGLQEIGNIGAGHAAVALTQFLNRSTYMSIPKVGVDNVQAISRFVKMPPDKNVAIISTRTTSDLLFSLMVFLEDQSVSKIIDLMTESEEITELLELSPLFMSLIKEIGSILLLKYVEALNFFLKCDSFPTPPKLRIGTVQSLNDFELKELKEDITSVLWIQCDVFTSEKNVRADLAIVPHIETFDQFMKTLFEDR